MRMKLPLDDPNVGKIEADWIYAQKMRQGILKKEIMLGIVNDLLTTEFSSFKAGGLPRWQRPLYEAGLCMLQEKLSAENDFLYGKLKEEKKTAEPIYFVIKPIFQPIVTPQYFEYLKTEIPLHTENIARAKQAKGGLYPWMVEGFEIRIRQVKEVIAQGIDKL
ncbi:hypothetical protein HGRIS_011357 [Hohenbuehelia grisea]|uniref:Uncharacterized protein n=1 Tax=Hohenbuehelia grisea TaxID=104357 RepID=A0ABR3JX16_9AGAR